MSYVICLMSNAYVDPWDMLNNFCFHVYAQKSLLIAENCNAFFWTSAREFAKHKNLCTLYSETTNL